MAMTKLQEDNTPSADEDKVPNQPNQNSVNSLVEELRNRLERWDTKHMARVIHKGVRGSTDKGLQTFKASR